MTNAANTNREDNRRRLQGIVTSAKALKTITVRVERRVQHPKYGKTYTVSTKFMAHDEKGMAHVGDLVEISEVRPISTKKRWRYVKTITPAV
ncbi:30S ribosomal protein S17 [Patescibacteria group bacterium]|nr:30S ribosomal protein S17 [Patescibacteria group bacterium]